MIIARIIRAQAQGKRFLTVKSVAFHITDIIDIEHRHGQKARGTGRKTGHMVQIAAVQGIGARNSDQTKKNKHVKIALRPVPVRIFVRGGAQCQ
jgi:hypothetical protein